MIEPFTLQQFLDESNRIEGMGPASPDFVDAAERFLARTELFKQDMIDFVAVAQPNAVIRDMPHLNIRVGNHIAPRGGPEIVGILDGLLHSANYTPFRASEAYQKHVMYETLHPFTDGNGRSGRILWLWMMGGIEHAPLGFLHTFYYQTLQNSREEL